MSETKGIVLLVFGILLAGALMLITIPELGGRVGGVITDPYIAFPESEAESSLLPYAQPDKTEPEVLAKSVLIKDVRSGAVLYTKSASQRLPIASLTKLMTAVVAWEKIRGGDRVVRVELEDTLVPSYRAYLRTGEEITFYDLLRAMIISSANDATLAVARTSAGSVEAFVWAMNGFANRLDLRDTQFQNPVGFDDPNHYSSASDLGVIVEEFLRHPDLVEMAGMADLRIYSTDGFIRHDLTTTNRLLGNREGVVGLKTGYTEEAKGNLVVLVEDGMARYYVIILGSENREADAEALLEWIKQNFVWK